MLQLLFSVSEAKQKVFQWKAPTAPGSSTDALFVFVLIAAQHMLVTVLCRVQLKWELALL